MLKLVKYLFVIGLITFMCVGAAQKYEFQTEVNKLLGIIINSLYTNKDIFLRELISNGSDALDKIRFNSLTDTNAMGETTSLEIRIKADKAEKTLTIRDTGVGMTKDDLVANLGTIAKSGTKSFVEKLSEGADLNLIGQFGVGFYSAFLVADTVTVVTKSNDDKQYIWQSAADSTFTIEEDPRGNTLGRGTEIVLKLKEDASEYLDQDKLEELIRRYSEFIHFPIYLQYTKEVEKEVPVEEEPATEKPKADDDTEEKKEGEEDEVDVEDEKKEDDDKPKTKKVKEQYQEWNVVNENKPIWTRNPKDLEQEDYNKFYKTLSKDQEDPLAQIHFTAEGQDVIFKSILYIPGRAPFDISEQLTKGKATNVKLYVRKVFITDEFTDLLPRYLTFIRGVVDSDDLPLNVSRELLQQSKLLRIIKKTLTRKALELIKELSAEEEAENQEKSDEQDSESKKEEKSEKKGRYAKFWKEFGKNIRLGVVEDSSNKARLVKLLRYQSSKSGSQFISLDTYVSRMKEGQKDIYYLAGESLEAVKNSPFLENLKKKGFEVLFLVEPIDEYVAQQVTDFEGKKLVNIAREGLKFDDEKDSLKKFEKKFEPLITFAKKFLSGKVDKVAVSTRLSGSPCVLVAPSHGITANMERIMRAQAITPEQLAHMKARKILEINPHHPIMKELNKRLNENTEGDESIKDTLELLYDTAQMQGGYLMDNTSQFASRIFKSLQTSLVADPNAVEEEEVEEVEQNNAHRDDHEDVDKDEL